MFGFPEYLNRAIPDIISLQDLVLKLKSAALPFLPAFSESLFNACTFIIQRNQPPKKVPKISLDSRKYSEEAAIRPLLSTCHGEFSEPYNFMHFHDSIACRFLRIAKFCDHVEAATSSTPFVHCLISIFSINHPWHLVRPFSCEAQSSAGFRQSPTSVVLASSKYSPGYHCTARYFVQSPFFGHPMFGC